MLSWQAGRRIARRFRLCHLASVSLQLDFFVLDSRNEVHDFEDNFFVSRVF